MRERMLAAARQTTEQALIHAIARNPEAAMRHIESLFDIRGRENLARTAEMYQERAVDGKPPVLLVVPPTHLSIADNFVVPQACGELRQAIRGRGLPFDGVNLPATVQLQNGAKGPLITAFWNMVSRQHSERYGVYTRPVARKEDLDREPEEAKLAEMRAQTRQSVGEILRDLSNRDKPRGLLIYPTGGTSQDDIQYGLFHRVVERYIGKRPIIMVPMVVDQTHEVITNESRQGKANVTGKAFMTLGLDVAGWPTRPIGVTSIRQPVDLSAALAERDFQSGDSEALVQAVNAILISRSEPIPTRPSQIGRSVFPQ